MRLHPIGSLRKQTTRNFRPFKRKLRYFELGVQTRLSRQLNRQRKIKKHSLNAFPPVASRKVISEKNKWEFSSFNLLIHSRKITYHTFPLNLSQQSSKRAKSCLQLANNVQFDICCQYNGSTHRICVHDTWYRKCNTEPKLGFANISDKTPTSSRQSLQKCKLKASSKLANVSKSSKIK